MLKSEILDSTIVRPTVADLDLAPQAERTQYEERLAFKWVQKYISAFGGDPTKVTM